MQQIIKILQMIYAIFLTFKEFDLITYIICKEY